MLPFYQVGDHIIPQISTSKTFIQFSYNLTKPKLYIVNIATDKILFPDFTDIGITYLYKDKTVASPDKMLKQGKKSNLYSFLPSGACWSLATREGSLT